MTSAFLRMFSEIKSVSKNLLEFLNYFGSYFDPATTVIENQEFNKKHHHLPDPMTIIDPLNKFNNTTRSAFRIKEI